MRTQLQAISLRIQTVRSNEQMAQSMKGATSLLGSMNRSMNLPALQRIAMEFEKENDIMDQRQEMMDDAIDDVTGIEDEEEGEEVVKEVLDEIGVDLGQAVRIIMSSYASGLDGDADLKRYRWAKRRQAYKRPRWRMDGWQKLSAVELVRVEEVEVLEEAEEEEVQMMIYKPDWIVYDDSTGSRSMKSMIPGQDNHSASKPHSLSI